MARTLQTIKEERLANNQELVAIIDKIGDAQPTEAQAELMNECKTKEATLKEQHELLFDIQNVATELGQVAPEIPNHRDQPLTNHSFGDGLFGYDRLHSFLSDCYDSETTGKIPERLMNFQVHLANAVGSDEQAVSTDPYGGFLAPPGFLPQLLSVDPENDPTARGGIAPVFEIPIASQSIDIPARVDKTHATSVTGGLQVYRRAETVAGTSSRMQVEKVTLKPVSLFGLAYATEEILTHSAISMTALIQQGMRDEFTSEIFDEKINGTGAGELEGILNCPAALGVTRTTAANLKGEDIVNVRQQMWRYNRCIWLANHDTMAMLAKASQTGSGGNSDVFYFRAGTTIPGTGDNPSLDVPDSLLGRPIIFSEFVPALGTAGDLICWDPSQYLFGVGVGAGAMGSAESIHVRFVNHERTFKFWQMNDGRCWWRSALAPRNGANSLSPIVYVGDA